jgi:hypothetical protein
MLHAMQLAEEGFAVFPCHRSKKPACAHGFRDATNDPAQLRALWGVYPGELVGIATGSASNLAVLDIDAKHRTAHEWWAAHRAQLLPTSVLRTRSGGLHLWFRNMPGLRCSVSAIASGVDVRAEGGYVIAWQCAGFPVLVHAPLARWPDWLSHAGNPRVVEHFSEPARVPDNKQLAALVRFVATAPEQQRNVRLFWAACRMAGMVNSHYLSESEAEELLVAAAKHAGLPESEARKTARSGLATGKAG